jgi:26S proteasome regulatory subunit N9
VFFLSLQARPIEGIIDQVDGVVHVSWGQPRVLGIDQVSLCDRLDILDSEGRYDLAFC